MASDKHGKPRFGAKSEFVRSLDPSIPAAEVVALAEKRGLKLTTGLVYNIRSASNAALRGSRARLAQKPTRQVAQRHPRRQRGSATARGHRSDRPLARPPDPGRGRRDVRRALSVTRSRAACAFAAVRAREHCSVVVSELRVNFGRAERACSARAKFGARLNGIHLQRVAMLRIARSSDARSPRRTELQSRASRRMICADQRLSMSAGTPAARSSSAVDERSAARLPSRADGRSTRRDWGGVQAQKNRALERWSSRARVKSQCEQRARAEQERSARGLKLGHLALAASSTKLGSKYSSTLSGVLYTPFLTLKSSTILLEP